MAEAAELAELQASASSLPTLLEKQRCYEEDLRKFDDHRVKMQKQQELHEARQSAARREASLEQAILEAQQQAEQQREQEVAVVRISEDMIARRADITKCTLRDRCSPSVMTTWRSAANFKANW